MEMRLLDDAQTLDNKQKLVYSIRFECFVWNDYREANGINSPLFLSYGSPRRNFFHVKGDVKVGRKCRRAGYEGGRRVVNTDSNLDSHG